MKKYRLGFALFALVTIGFLASCNKDNVDETDNVITFDCSNFQQDFGDSCFTALNNIGVVTQNCECDGDDSTGTQLDCPNFNGNVGDICFIFGYEGIITADCDCVINNVFECPDLQANYNDSCWTALQLPGVVDNNCDCIEDQVNVFDCPNLQANIGDNCWNMNDMGTVDANCDCIVNMNTFDCPDLQAFVGDSCFSSITNTWAVVSAACDCE